MNRHLETKDSTPPNPGEKSRHLDLGLAVLSATAMPGATFTAMEIAEWCDCSGPTIAYIEARALRKLREGVRRAFKLSRADAKDIRRFLEFHSQT